MRWGRAENGEKGHEEDRQRHKERHIINKRGSQEWKKKKRIEAAEQQVKMEKHLH